MKRLVLFFLIAGIAFGAASCGKKEPLKPPQGATYPRQYPPP